jgi:hypothetical protein
VGIYEYSGKPSGVLHVPAGDYKRIDADVPDPSVGALEFQSLYANCALHWRDGTDGWIQVKYVRENGDSTAYQTYSVTRSLSNFLITANHFEKGAAGQGGRWGVKCGGGLASLDIDTRYVKLATAT